MVATQRTVILIEPDALLGNVYRDALESAGFFVMIATSAQAALHLMSTNLPDVIVLEVMMKQNNGIEFIYELQSYSDTARIPIILLTYAQKSALGLNLKLQKQLSIIEYCYKPKTTLTELIQVVSSVETRVNHE